MFSQKLHINKNQANSHLDFDVLRRLPEGTFIQVQSSTTSHRFAQFIEAGSKVKMAVFLVHVPRAKLQTSLETYEWRHKTKLPIVKVKHVFFKDRESNMSNIFDLEVYLEDCPLTLDQMGQMDLWKSIYLLKQSMIAFERLYFRFGGFRVREQMICLNEKGQCKVWINQNYAYNTLKNAQIGKEDMLIDILKLIEMHSSQTKESEQLFGILRNCHSFLDVFDKISVFVKRNKILVPSRLSLVQDRDRCHATSFKTSEVESPRTPSRIPRRFKGNMQEFNQPTDSKQSPQSTQLQKQLKRFNSDNHIKNQMSIMKVSDGDTAYTHNHGAKTSNVSSNNFSSPSARQERKDPKLKFLSLGPKQKQWVEDSQYIMGGEESQDVESRERSQKQLSHSEALQPEPQFCSLRIKKKKDSVQFEFDEPLMSFQLSQSQILNFQLAHQQQSQQHNPSNQEIKREEEEEEQKLREHQEKVLKENGWQMMTDILYQATKNLNNSYHSGEQDVLMYQKNVSLKKLGSMGRREVMMSLLPQEDEDCN